MQHTLSNLAAWEEALKLISATGISNTTVLQTLTDQDKHTGMHAGTLAFSPSKSASVLRHTAQVLELGWLHYWRPWCSALRAGARPLPTYIKSFNEQIQDGTRRQDGLTARKETGGTTQLSAHSAHNIRSFCSRSARRILSGRPRSGKNSRECRPKYSGS